MLFHIYIASVASSFMVKRGAQSLYCHEICRLKDGCTCRADASDADKQKAEKELLQKIKEALPEATEPWLVQIVPQKLAEAGL